MAKHFTKESLLKASRPKVKEITLNGYDETVLIKSFSAREALEISEQSQNASTKEEQKALSFNLISKSVVDASGNPILTVEDVMDMDVEIFNQLLQNILSSLGVTDKQIEQARGQLENNPLEDSASN